MSAAEAALLGVLQGLTEFFPVSSSGHLVLGQALLGIRLPGVFFEVILHLATLLSVVWVYRGRLLGLARGVLEGERESWRYVALLALASVPAGAVGLLAEAHFEAAFGRPAFAAAFLLLSGVLAWSIRHTGPRARDSEPGVVQAVWIGVAQAAAILPGLSRSGSTVAAAAWRGVEVVKAAEFSFLLSVPAILGAGLLQAGEIRAAGASVSPVALASGFGAALLSGVFAIRLFVRLLEGRRFHLFGVYCWTVGGTYLLAALLVPGLR